MSPAVGVLRVRGDPPAPRGLGAEEESSSTAIAWRDLRGRAVALSSAAERRAALAGRLEAALEVRVLPSRDPPNGAVSILLTAGALAGEEGVAAAGRGAGRGKAAGGAPAGAVGGGRGRTEAGGPGRRAAEGAAAGADRTGDAAVQGPRRRAPESAGSLKQSGRHAFEVAYLGASAAGVVASESAVSDCRKRRKRYPETRPGLRICRGCSGRGSSVWSAGLLPCTL
jgi:hypothetical protein